MNQSLHSENPETRTSRRIPLLLTVLGFTFLELCCSGKTVKEVAIPFEKAKQESEVDRLWKERFPGPITDIALAEKTGFVLASSIPDVEAGGKYLLTLLNRKGKQIFQNQMKTPVKSLDLSEDGTFMVINHHGGMLVAYNQEGKELWEAEGACRPMILNRAKEILCYHDDDTKPSYAFDVYNFEGKRIARYPVRHDVLALKVSTDEQWISIALTGGRALLMNSKYRLVREFRVKGEILDVAVSSGAEPRLATLSMAVEQGQLISLFEQDGKLRGTAKPPVHVEQIELLPSGQLLAVYGNSPKGQYIAQYAAHDLTQTWQRQDPRYADYSLSIQLGVDKILMGFEDLQEKSRTSKLLVLDLDGKLRADIPLETAEGAYLYSFAYSPESALLAVGTDDKQLQLYELN